MSGQIPRANLRKRRAPVQHDPSQNSRVSQDLAPSHDQPPLKRQRLSDHSQHEQPHRLPQFWDKLSRIWLTRSALEELDRRNAQHSHQDVQDSRKAVQFSVDAYLTPRILKDIRRFARHGGPNLSDLTGFPIPVPTLNCTPTMSSSRSGSSARTGSGVRKRASASTSKTKATTEKTKPTQTSKSSGPYDQNFQQRITDGGVFPYGYRYPDGRFPPRPVSFNEINRELEKPRPSLFPPHHSVEEKFDEFVYEDSQVCKENKVTKRVIPIIEGEIRDVRCEGGDIPFNNLAPLDGFTEDDLTKAKPDLYYGARPEQLNPKIRRELGRHIIPSRDDSLPMVPNFFLEAKGPDGSLAVALRQACYDGALGARGMQSLRSYSQGAGACDNRSYTISTIYHGGTLKVYCHYACQPNGPDANPEYYMHQLNAWSLTGNPGSFVKGITAFRNARDLAERWRNEAIAHANDVVRATAVDAGHAADSGNAVDTANDGEMMPPPSVRLSRNSDNL